MRSERDTTIPPSEITATSLVPPPTSTTTLARGSPIASPAPIAAASDSSIRCTERAPAARHASISARCSTSVIPEGAQIITRGWASRLRCTRPMKWRSICSVTSKSAITPWRSGRTAVIVAGVRPIIPCASSPTACTAPLSESMATTDGSDTTMPSPRTKTSVFAVPRSMARSWPPRPRHRAAAAAGARAESTPAPPAPVSLPSAISPARVMVARHGSGPSRPVAR